MTSSRTLLLRPAAAAAALIVAAAGLTGCGIAFTPDSGAAAKQPSESQRSAQQSSAPQPEAQGTSEAHGPSEAEGSPKAQQSAAPDGGITDLESLSEIEDLSELPPAELQSVHEVLGANVTKSVSCPNGVLDISGVGDVIALESDCTSITVSGNGMSVLARNIDALEVTGTGNTLFVAELGSVNTTGNGNTVAWSTGDPVVTESGVGNVLLPTSWDAGE